MRFIMSIFIILHPFVNLNRMIHDVKVRVVVQSKDCLGLAKCVFGCCFFFIISYLIVFWLKF